MSRKPAVTGTSPIRVLHLINRPQMRGAEMFASRLATHLERGEFQNAICSLYPQDDENGQFDAGAVPMYRLDVRPTILDRIIRVDPMVVLRLRRVLQDFKPDVIVGHGTDTLKYASVSRYMRRNALTVYLNIGKASYWANTRSRVWFNRFWLRNIDCSVSVSKHTRQDFIDHYGFDESRVVHIPNAVQVEAFDEASAAAVRRQMRAELGIDDEEVVIGMVGSFSAGKGQETLIRAAARLIEKGHPVTLALAGDGPERADLEAASRAEGIGSRVRFLGLRADIPRVLSGMDIFALASLSEGMPGVLIEAGLSGLPSVAYDVGGVTEVLTHGTTGLVVSSDDFAGLVDALEELASRPDRRKQLGDQARSWCRTRFDLSQVADQYADLLKLLLDGSLPATMESTAVNAEK